MKEKSFDSKPMSKILVIGSSNTDLIANVEYFPSAGETVEGKLFFQAIGGKGANQAVAAHRLGGNVKFVTCLGDDSNGQSTMKYYKEEGLDVSTLRIVKDVPTGTAMILVNKEGENCIVITPGANNELTPDFIETIEEEIASSHIVVLQMEIPLASVEKICELAVKYDTEILMNVAPAREISNDLLKKVDILVVNETEIEKVSGESISKIGEDAVMDKLIGKGAKTVILTLGRNGCIVKNLEVNERVPAFQVDTVDSTAAGDTFCGSLVAQLSKGHKLIEAVKFATAASAICVTRMGAQPSIPTEEEVNQFLKKDVAVVDNGHSKSNTNKKVI